MKIVFNTRSLFEDNQQEKYFLYELLKRIIIKYQEHEFIIITDRAHAKSYLFGKNVTTVIARQQVSHPLLRKLWFDFKLPVILKKHKADIFVSCDFFCSMTSQLPQCLLLDDFTFFYNTPFIKRLNLFFYKRYVPKFLTKANTIISVSKSFKRDLSLRYKEQEDKIDVIYTAVKEIFLPVDEREKEQTKRKYSKEKNYFLYTGFIHSYKSLTSLLKAFSVFKKRQKSNWKFVLTGNIERESKSFTENLKTYKYREDIILTGFVKEEDLVKLVGSAYALVYPFQWDRIGTGMLEAINCRIPVIASANPSIKEIAEIGRAHV